METLPNKLIIEPPHADFVFIASASWWFWAGLFVLILLIAASFAAKKKGPDA